MRNIIFLFLFIISCHSCDIFYKIPYFSQYHEINDTSSIDSAENYYENLSTDTDINYFPFSNYLISDTAPNQPSQTIKADLIHTILDVSFDWKNKKMPGTAVIKLVPHFYPITELELDAVGFIIEKVELLTDSNNIPLAYEYNDKIISIALNKSYTRKDTLIVEIQYIAQPEDLIDKGLIHEWDEKGLFFVNPDGNEECSPRQVWTHSEPQSASCWFPTIDAPNRRMSQELYITVDYDMTAVSNGSFIYSTLNKDSTWTYYWRQDIPHPPYLTSLVAGKFSKVKDMWKDKDVVYYTDPEYGIYARDIFGRTPEMLEFFSQKFGFRFPWDKYAQIIVHDFASGAMENTSCTFFGDFAQFTRRELLDNNIDDVIAHELSHQWFGNTVTCESWANLFLNEAFATYSEFLWAEYKQGSDEAMLQLENMRANYFFESIFKIESLVRYNYNYADDVFDAHTYSKGALILHTLRQQVGDEAFFESIRRYLNKFQFQSAEVHDLRLIFEQVTGQDLNWFFNQWFFKKGHPQIEFSYKYDTIEHVLEITFGQVQKSPSNPVFIIPAGVEIYYDAQLIKKEEFMLFTGTQVKKFPCQKEPDLVWPVLDKALLSEVKFSDMNNNFMLLYNRHRDYFTRKQVLDLVEQSALPDSVKHSCYYMALSDNFWNIRRIAVNYFNRNFINFHSFINEEIKTKLIEIAANDKSSEVRASALTCLSYFDGDDIINLFINAIEDSSYQVMETALQALLKSDEQKAHYVLSELEKSNDKKTIEILGRIYCTTGNEPQNNFYQNGISNFKGKTRLSLMSNYLYYLISQNDSLLLNGFDFFADFARSSEDWLIRRQAVYSLKTIHAVKEPETTTFSDAINNIYMKGLLTAKDSVQLDSLNLRVSFFKNQLDYFNSVIQDILSKEKDFRIVEMISE
ncbi:MAG: M1 family metallopeptidase [Bacteroidia bacterium]|nr:M1 family metallopeptidase [Bacteroidia bacterium]